MKALLRIFTGCRWHTRTFCPSGVTPDQDAVAALERRRAGLSYYPKNGFLRDRKQQRKDSRTVAIWPILQRKRAGYRLAEARGN